MRWMVSRRRRLAGRCRRGRVGIRLRPLPRAGCGPAGAATISHWAVGCVMELPTSFQAAKRELCGAAAGLASEETSRFVALFPLALGNVAVNNGKSVYALGELQEGVGTLLRDVLRAAGSAQALVLDRQTGDCWIAPRDMALQFVRAAGTN